MENLIDSGTAGQTTIDETLRQAVDRITLPELDRAITDLESRKRALSTLRRSLVARERYLRRHSQTVAPAESEVRDA